VGCQGVRGIVSKCIRDEESDGSPIKRIWDGEVQYIVVMGERKIQHSDLGSEANLLRVTGDDNHL